MSSKECCEGHSTATDDSGEIACTGCGTVLGRDESTGLGKRLFNEEDMINLSHEAPLDTSISNGSTLIGYTNKDHSGKMIPAKSMSDMKRQRLWDSRSRGRNKKVRPDLLRKIDSSMRKMNMKSAHIADGKRILTKVMKGNLMRGRTVNDVHCAIIYTVSKKYDMGRTIKGLTKEMGANRKSMMKAYRVIHRAYGDDHTVTGAGDIRSPEGDNTIYARRAMQKMNLPNVVEDRIKKYMSDAMRLQDMQIYMGGKSMVTMSAATMYCIGLLDKEIGKYLTQRSVADAFNITDATVRHRYMEILNIINKNKDDMGLA